MSDPLPTVEKDAGFDAGCTCAEIAEVVGFRLTDDNIMALCDRLRPRVFPPGGGDA